MRDGVVVYEEPGDPAITAGQRLPADAMRALEASGIEVDAIDLFAVAAGPGSFTGLRVGIATIQGLAMARGRKVVAVSVLDALARAGTDGVHPVAAWMDAQRGQVFAARYSREGSPLSGGASSLTPAETFNAWRDAGDPIPARFIGDGAVRYADVIHAEAGAGAVVLPHPLLAGVIARMAHDNPSRAVLPHAVVPLYVRRPDAELARARQAREG
jgi:tRNA threonylcarbamoyladenosine biosynthesis protein TsaB